MAERVDLEWAEDLHQSTTPGPWELADGGWGVYVIGRGDEPVWTREWVANPADAEFVVEAHRRWPGLVAELGELRKFVEDATYGVEQLQQQRNDWVSRASEYARQRDDAHEEIARLEAQLRDAIGQATGQSATADQPPGAR